MTLTRRSMLKSTAILGSAATSLPKMGHADVAPAYGPDDLKSTLTPLGGLRAGNAKGTIPAWTGAPLAFPADYVSGAIRPDLFAHEAPVATVTGANVAEHQDKLSAGYMKLLQTYPDYQIIVYPTHRTAIAPQYVYDYTYKNATSAQLSPDENSLSGAYGGIPFPIPKTGKQIMWNHLLRWCGVTIHSPDGDYQITNTGEVILRGFADVKNQWPYYFEGRENEFGAVYQQNFITDSAPAYVEGEAVVTFNTINPLQAPAKAWQYELGERRVRLAPQLIYDTPIDISGDVLDWDESLMFLGALDQYDCKIIGKKELYVPYNCNKTWATPVKDVAGLRHASPAVMRFELHRVWVVEMTLAAGKRNVDLRRVMYVDEDTWLILTEDIFDASDVLWKHFQAVPALCSDIPMHGAGFYTINYDFHNGSYVLFAAYDGGGNQWAKIPELPATFFSAGQLAATAGGS